MGIVAEVDFMEKIEQELFKEQIGSVKSETCHSKKRNGIGKRWSNRMLQPVSLVDGLWIFFLILSAHIVLIYYVDVQFCHLKGYCMSNLIN